MPRNQANACAHRQALSPANAFAGTVIAGEYTGDVRIIIMVFEKIQRHKKAKIAICKNNSCGRQPAEPARVILYLESKTGRYWK
jgi:hypothetical protein